MSRSVSVPSNYASVAYTTFDYDPDDWDYIVDELRGALNKAFPSVVHQDCWLGREDHAIAGNGFALFGLSEYCGLVAAWIVPNEPSWGEPGGWENLRDQWIAGIDEKFQKVIEAVFGERLRLVGRASNGEAFYERAA